jgi:hypothetical protein
VQIRFDRSILFQSSASFNGPLNFTMNESSSIDIQIYTFMRRAPVCVRVRVCTYTHAHRHVYKLTSLPFFPFV